MLDTLLVGSAHPEWFRPWPDIERCASGIRLFAPIVVTGLLQTEAYGRALTGDDEAAAARLGRQQILTGDHPPEVVTILDESVLHRRVAGAEVMHRQLRHLADPPAAVRVQVLPAARTPTSAWTGRSRWPPWRAATTCTSTPPPGVSCSTGRR